MTTPKRTTRATEAPAADETATETPAAPAAPSSEPTAAEATTDTQPPVRTVEDHLAAHETPAWLAASAKMKHQWAIGYTLGEDEFLSCLKEAAEEPVGRYVPEGHTPDEPAAEAE